MQPQTKLSDFIPVSYTRYFTIKAQNITKKSQKNKIIKLSQKGTDLFFQKPENKQVYLSQKLHCLVTFISLLFWKINMPVGEEISCQRWWQTLLQQLPKAGQERMHARICSLHPRSWISCHSIQLQTDVLRDLRRSKAGDRWWVVLAGCCCSVCSGLPGITLANISLECLKMKAKSASSGLVGHPDPSLFQPVSSQFLQVDTTKPNFHVIHNTALT